VNFIGSKTSTEKKRTQVSENRRQIQELVEDVVRTLCDLENLTRENEGTFQGPDLLHTLENLKKWVLLFMCQFFSLNPEK
jgi:hypothetical protein